MSKQLETLMESIESRLNVLESDLGNIASLYSAVLNTLEKVDDKLSRESGLRLNLDNTPKPFTEVPKEDKPKVFPKDSELLRKLIYQSNNEKTTSFLKNILDNKYPTITQKQKDVIDSIANSMYV